MVVDKGLPALVCEAFGKDERGANARDVHRRDERVLPALRASCHLHALAPLRAPVRALHPGPKACLVEPHHALDQRDENEPREQRKGAARPAHLRMLGALFDARFFFSCSPAP